MSLQLKLLAASMLFACASAALAQPASPLAGKDGTSGVYVRDSAIAVEKLALADRMERLKEWEKSADVYQEVVDKYSDRIVPSQLDKNQTIYQYTSVVQTVQKRLAKWPIEGLTIYLHKFEPAAATMLEGAHGDAAALHRVVSQYFVTDAGKTAALRLIDLYLESGEFAAAAWLGGQLLESHPNLQADRAKLMYRTALAHHLAGDDKAATALLEQLKQKEPDTAGLIRGTDTKLAAALEEELKIPPPKAHDASSESWPMLSGSLDRARIPDAAGKPGAKLFEIPISQTNRPIIKDPTLKPSYLATLKNSREAGLMLGIMPVVDHGELFFQDNARIYALRLESNAPLPGWQETYGSERRHGQYLTENATSIPRSVQLDVTLTDNCVLAVLGQLDRLAMANQAGPPARESKLVCLDRQSGKEKWVMSVRKLPDSAANLRTVELGGAPLVVGDNVYVTARGGKPMQFEDAYVLCFGLNDGAFRWACYVASGSVPGEIFDGAIALSENISQLAYSSGRLYVLTNLGAAAAIDAYRGTIVWLNMYPRPNQNFQPRYDLPNMNSSAQRPWAFNPPVVKDGKVFVLPADANHLLIYDAGSGVEVQRIHLADFDDPDTLLGIVGEKLLLAGKHRLWCINWQAYDVTKAREGNLIWWSKQGEDEQELPNRAAAPSIAGRGFVTSDSVVLPLRKKLKRFDLKSGRVVETYPANGDWNDREEEPGNILITHDYLIIAGMDRVNVYTDMKLAREKLDREVAAAPTSPEPRLRYAEMMFVSGDYELTQTKLDEAIAMIGGKDAMQRGPVRDRVFADALAFAKKVGDLKAGTNEWFERTEALFVRAGAAADSPAQQVQYRMARMKFALGTSDYAARVKWAQQILSDPAMRAISISSDGSSMPQLAGAMAEDVIAKCIHDYPAIYKAFDEEAAMALAQARQTNDPTTYLNVSQTYPNAKVAAEAMLAAAECYENAKNFRSATQVLNLAYRRYSDRNEDDKAKLIEAQARNYLSLPNGLGIALIRLQEGAKMRTKPSLQHSLKLPDGTTLENITFAAAVETLRKYNAVASTRSLPDFHIPIPPANRPPTNPFLPEDPKTVIANVDDLLVPLRDFGRNDRLVTWSGTTGVSIYAVGTTAALGSSAVLGEHPRGAAWLGDRLLVFGATKMAMLQGENAAVIWEASIKTFPRAEMVASGDPPAEEPEAAQPPVARGRMRRVVLNNQQVIIVNNRVIGRGMINGPAGMFQNNLPAPQPGEGESIRFMRPVGDRFIISTSTGRVAAIEVAGGKVAWQTRLTEKSLDQLLATDDFIAARFSDDQGTQIIALDMFAGQVAYRRLFNGTDGLLPVNMALSADGQLVYTLPDQICIKDLFQAGGELIKFPENSDGSMTFAGASGIDQLVVSDGRILAVSDNGAFVHVHSLQTGRMISQKLATGTANNLYVGLRIVGSHMYVASQTKIMGYNLDAPEDTWSGGVMTDVTPTVRDLFISNNFVALLDQPNTPPGRAPAVAPYRLLLYGIYPNNHNGQAGRIDYFPWIREPRGITDWQAVDGGFYYRSGDAKLHFLRGTGKG